MDNERKDGGGGDEMWECAGSSRMSSCPLLAPPTVCVTHPGQVCLHVCVYSCRSAQGVSSLLCWGNMFPQAQVQLFITRV